MEDNIFSPQISTFEPFASNVDSSRTNMSSKQLLQTVVGDNVQTPFIINRNFTDLSKVSSPFIEFASDDGFVLYNSNNILMIVYWGEESKGKYKGYYLPQVKQLVNNSLSLRYSITKTNFKKGDCLFDYTNQIIENNLPRIGYRTKIAYTSFFGYTAEDALVISKSFANRATIEYSDTLYIPITPEFKYNKNENGNYLFKKGEMLSNDYYLSYMKIDTTRHPYNEFSNISSKKSKIFTKYVETLQNGHVTNIKLHPYVSAKTKEETKEFYENINNDFYGFEDKYLYVRDIIKEIKELYFNQRLIKEDIISKINKRMPQEGLFDEIVDQFFSKHIESEQLPKVLIESIIKKYNIIEENIDFILEIDIVRKEPTKVGDKFANLFAGKGVVSKIIPDELMPHDEEGPVDIIFNPLGIFGRNNWGTIYELVLSKLIRDVEKTISNKSVTLNKIKFIKNHLIKNISDEEYYNLVEDLINNWDNKFQEFKEDVIKNGFYLFIGNFPGITYHDFINKFITPYENRFKVNLTKTSKLTYSKELIKYMRKNKFQSTVFQQDDIYESVVDCQIAENYFLKLYHTAVSKYNSISGATTFSTSTGQMSKGKADKGGTHISWQTTSAVLDRILEGNVLKEFLTVKADCIEDKNRLNESIILTGKFNMKEVYDSRTKELINSSLKINGLSFDNPTPKNDLSITRMNETKKIDAIDIIDDLFE